MAVLANFVGPVDVPGDICTVQSQIHMPGTSDTTFDSVLEAAFAVLFPGVSDLQLLERMTFAHVVTMPGTSDLELDTQARMAVAVTLPGTSDLDAITALRQRASVSMPGISGFVATSRASIWIYNLSLPGTSGASFDPRVVALVEVEFEGLSDLVVQRPIGSMIAEVIAAGVSAFEASGVGEWNHVVTFPGVSNFRAILRGRPFDAPTPGEGEGGLPPEDDSGAAINVEPFNFTHREPFDAS